ncbi:MAG: HTTM domain-containing protein [Deltaproteobacteria bacterium]|nr:HTTM domain-containing protein [Deltaproteobacteria bacterium]
MAKQGNRSNAESRQARRAEARKAERSGGEAPAARVPAKPTSEPIPEPKFWFGFEVSWAKLVLARFVIFTVLAIDSVLQISHAPRYGAGGFNVAQVPGLDAIGPGRLGFEVGQLVCAYVFILVAFGVATRFLIPIGAAIYGWLYFGSQLDSYQHHYLVVLVLLIACFIPWQRPDGAEPATRIRTWGVRLLLVQLGILYVWAAISKMSPAWLDGRTITGQITGPLRSVIEDSVGFKTAARFALLTELVLAVVVWMRPAWFIALPVGLAFHVGILASGLEIGLFAYLMLAFYVFVIPDRALVWLATRAPLRGARWAIRAARISNPVAAASAVLLAVTLGVLLARFTRFESAFEIAIVLSVVPITLLIGSRLRGGTFVVPWLALAHVVAIALWLVLDRTTTTAIDYYRFWGGNARRLGEPAVAEAAYRRLTEIAPNEPNGHFQLGRILIDGPDEDAGLRELREAQRLEPRRARAWIAEAQWLARKGRTAEAIEKAQEAVLSEPTHPSARELLDTLSGKKSASPAAPARDDDGE